MDQSGCKEVCHRAILMLMITTHYNFKLFSISEVHRFLPAKTFDLWERIKQEKAIKQAGIEGLESSAVVLRSVSLILTRRVSPARIVIIPSLLRMNKRNCFIVEMKTAVLSAVGNARSLFAIGQLAHFKHRTDPHSHQDHLPKSCEGDYAA
jgi:hypothetical protein